MAFYGLDIADIDFNGYPDIVASGNLQGGGIFAYLNQGNNTYIVSPSPTSYGIYNDLKLANMNGDSYYDMVAASQGGGIQAWLGTTNLYWDYWYNPITTAIFNAVKVFDINLDNIPDVVGASWGHGIKIYINRNPSAEVNPVFFCSVISGTASFEMYLVNYNKIIPLTITKYPAKTL